MVSVKQCTFIIQPLTISECDWSQVFVSVSKLKNLKTVHGYITLFKPMHRLLLKKTVSMRTWRTSNETLDTTWPCSDRLGLASQPAVSLHLLGSHPCCYFCAFAIKDITSANFLKRKKKKKFSQGNDSQNNSVWAQRERQRKTSNLQPCCEQDAG